MCAYKLLLKPLRTHQSREKLSWSHSQRRLFIAFQKAAHIFATSIWAPPTGVVPVHKHHVRRHRTSTHTDRTARNARRTSSRLENLLSLSFVRCPRIWMVFKVRTASVPALEAVQTQAVAKVLQSIGQANHVTRRQRCRMRASRLAPKSTTS